MSIFVTRSLVYLTYQQVIIFAGDTMRKPIVQAANLYQLAQLHDHVAQRAYLKQLGNTTIRDQELTGLSRLLTYFPGNLAAFKHVYVGYDVPQISKEFDLLLVSSDRRIINIELKSDADYPEDKVRKQLVSNHYYLSQITPDVQLYTYNSDANRLYTLTPTGDLEHMTLTHDTTLTQSPFFQAVMGFKSVGFPNLAVVLQPESYTVSPFTQLSFFLKGQYRLMQPQQALKVQLLATTSSGIYAVKTATSVGKTLMIYDVVQTLRASHAVLLVHIGALNAAQATLKRQYGWYILPERQFLKKIKSQRMRHYDVVIVDDAQRLSIRHVHAIQRYFEAHDTRVFLIGDPNQQNKATIKNSNYFATITRNFGQQHLLKLPK